MTGGGEDRSNEDLLLDIMDGRVWKMLGDHEGVPFFGEHALDELRFAVTLNLAWYVLNIWYQPCY